MSLYSSIMNEIGTEDCRDAGYPLLDDTYRLEASTDELIVCRNNVNWAFCFANSDRSVYVSVNNNYKQMRKNVCSDNVTAFDDIENSRFLLRTAFECRFCHEGIVSLHAACVELDGFAVAFTGHSGLGKSTRAKAWVDGLGAQWISGDRPAVRLERDGSTACGVPWDGKEQIFRDVEAPLRCILEVRRSPANYVRALSEEQARRVITQQCFIPMWDTDSAVLALSNVRSLIRKTPVYRVFCGPDAQDARAIYDIIVHHPEKIRKETQEMKIKEGFVLRNVVDEHIVMPTGDNIAKFEGAVVLNEVAAFVYKQLENPVGRDDLLAAMLAEYEIDEATAAADLDALLEQFQNMGLIEG